MRLALHPCDPFLINNRNKIGNSVEKMFCCGSKFLLTLNLIYTAYTMNATTNTACFAYNLRTRTESLKPCIQLFVHIKRKFFEPILFQNKSQQRGISQRLLDKPRVYLQPRFYFHINKVDIKQWTITCHHCQNPNIRTNSLSCSVLLWTSFCFLQVSQ